MRTRVARIYGWYFGVLLIGLAILFSRGLPALAIEAPNVVLILVDDLGYGDLGCYGSLVCRTPHIDRLASEGLVFTDFHANGPMCTPSRAALLTGLYQQRFGKEFEGPLSGLSQYDRGLPLQATTIAEVFQQNGYATAMYGKWHLGYRAPFLPTRQGFDDFRGLVSGDGDHHSHIDRSGRPDWWHNDRIKMEQGYSVDLITKHCIELLRRSKDRRFFLYVPHLAIHFPWQTPDDSGYRKQGTSYHNLTKLGQLESKDVGQRVRAMVEAVDNSVGQILAELRRLDLDRRTLVFFTSDNGGYLRYSGGYHNISSNGPLRGQKGEVFEGGHRVPAIARWHGQIKPGRMTAETAMTFDLFPTLLELCGLPSHEQLDGVSLASLLAGESKLPRRALFWRMEDQKAVRRGPWKLVIAEDTKPMLFNLDRDLGEKHDVATQHPEIVTNLLKSLATWEANVDRSTATP